MSKNLVITSAAQLAQILNNNPVLQQIPAFANLKAHILQIQQSNKSKCNACNANQNPFQQIRPQMEAALTNMSSDEFIKMKELLGLDQMCYYKLDNNRKMVMTCV